MMKNSSIDCFIGFSSWAYLIIRYSLKVLLKFFFVFLESKRDIEILQNIDALDSDSPVADLLLEAENLADDRVSERVFKVDYKLNT